MLDELSMDRPYLEHLTTAELLKLADSLGIDVPPELDRSIVIEELLETGSRRDEESPGAPPLGEKPLDAATAPLPKQYNISYIEVLIRDPLWAFAFWEINAHDKEILEAAPDFDGYCLRVSANLRFDNLDNLDNQPGAGDSFTVQVGTGDSAWYLGFPPEGGHSGGDRFQVELCAMRKDGPAVLAVSKPFNLPMLPESAEVAASNNPLLHLSGIDDFKILRNTIRSSRLLKRRGAQE